MCIVFDLTLAQQVIQILRFVFEMFNLFGFTSLRLL